MPLLDYPSMAYAQLREVFDKIRRVHQEAAQCCANLADGPDQRLSLLADLFRKRERAFARRLKAFEVSEHASLLDTWVQYVPFEGVDETLAALQADRAQGSSATLKACLELQQRIARFLRELADNLSAPKAHDFLQSLADSEESAVKDFGMAMLTENDA